MCEKECNQMGEYVTIHVCFCFHLMSLCVSWERWTTSRWSLGHMIDKEGDLKWSSWQHSEWQSKSFLIGSFLNSVFVWLASPGKFELFLRRATLLIDRVPNPFRWFILPISWRE